MNKYSKIKKKPYNSKSWTCFIGFIIAFIVSCSTLFFNLSEDNQLIVQIISFVIIDFVIFLNFCCIESKFIFDYAKENSIVSDFSKLCLRRAIKFNKVLIISFIATVILSIIIILFIGKVDINDIKLFSLTQQIIYILLFVVYKTCFLSLITAFGEEDLLTDMSVISYIDITEIIHIKTLSLYNIKLEKFNIIFNQNVVETDRLASDDYVYLINNVKKSS